ncbi:endonuclease IV [Gottschalkia acidurici 9a]|uniref:Probable endonuclease 4 n=1 Tax=Gottschalkia acidurici (strain ATCC 7906 / DSM 604 / BCRC 14475 / CIP 104303 / KCTC 5404 / NCIMB 10678 / 9a) TaxID=1128398 RepID=K0AW31_GOTA9|nr:deoxyribonuclease IV [Gottschalkia acidurici]AFS78088.1 endonuclease IV [Gottschalkia acidurici 9a]
MYLGCHLTISKGFLSAGEVAKSIGANTFQFFTRNPRGGKAKELDRSDINNLELFMKENDFGKLLAHAPYTLNMASYKENVWDFAKIIFKDDLKRLEEIPCSLYNFHPGSHTGKGVEYGIERITTILNEVITGNESTMVLLETMSGKGTEIGSNFEELKRIIDKVKYSEIMGVCLDTCHLYSAGYDIVNDLDGVLEEFDKVIGIEKIKAIHLNDSMTEFNSKKDRHAKIGEGTIGLEAIKNIINHPQLKEIPFLLETPNEVEGHKEEIEILRNIRL